MCVLLVYLLVGFGFDEDQSSETKHGELKLVFADDFEKKSDRWETTDDAAWRYDKNDGNSVFGLNRRKSDYKPPVRSPYNIALIKDLQVEDFVVTFDVRSTKDTGNHRDCCVFFCYQNPQQFYYVHLGAKPDKHSGQVMIVDQKPRLALTKNENLVAWTDDWHKVKLVRDSKKGLIEIYFDDFEKPLMSVTNNVFGKGRIGIGSFDDMNDFDNVKVYSK